MPFFKPGGGAAVTLLAVDWELIEYATPGNSRLTDVAYSPTLDLWCAVSELGSGTWLNQRALTSSTANNNDWTQRGLVAGSWKAITWSEALGMFATVRADSAGSQIATSHNGITWTVRTTPAQLVSLQGICAGKDKFVAVGQTASDASLNLGFYSTDGITWNNIAAGNNSQWRSVAYSPELDTYVAVAVTGSGGQSRVMQSDAGISWTLRSTPATRNWSQVDWSPELGLFLAIDSANHFITSSDGQTWTEGTMDPSAATNVWQGLAWSPVYGRFTTVSNSGTGKRVGWTADASTWGFDDPPETLNTWNRIKWGSSFYLAVGNLFNNRGIMRSCARFTVG